MKISTRERPAERTKFAPRPLLPLAAIFIVIYIHNMECSVHSLSIEAHADRLYERHLIELEESDDHGKSKKL